MSSRLSFLVLVVSFFCIAAPALAQSLPPDVVQLTNGGMVRGTIIENIPGDHVTIQLQTGETRRFGPGEVRSAGPAAVAPATPPANNAPVMQAPPPASPTGQVPQPPPGYGQQPPPAYGQQAPQLNPDLITLRVTATTPSVTLHRLTGSATMAVWTGRGMGYGVIDNFEPICTAPCAVQVPRGTYSFGLSQGEGRPRRADHAMFSAMQNTDLVLEYESREGIRIGGWVLFGVATAGYLAATFASLGADSDTLLNVLIYGTVIYLALMIPFLIMTSLNDHADVRQVQQQGQPLAAAPSGQF